MRLPKWTFIVAVMFLISLPSSLLAGKGYMGGQGTVVADDPVEPVDGEGADSGGVPDSVEGPLHDKMADSGKLFGDLSVILRQQGLLGDRKLVPEVDSEGQPVLTDGVQLFVEVENFGFSSDPIVGGEPVLTAIDPGQTNTFVDYGWYAAEIGENPDGSVIYGLARSPYPAQCVQPMAEFKRWGNIISKTGLTKNRIPMVVVYDATWGRSECIIGQQSGEASVDPVTGDLTIPVNVWFIAPGETWDYVNNADETVAVTYPDGVLWTALVKEVHFGRLNLSRSPDAVLQAAFDEAIRTINSPDTLSVSLDAAGRLLLTKRVYDEYDIDPDTGLPIELDEPVQKAIDSPLENLARS